MFLFNQQGPTAQHMELCSTLYGSLDGRGVWGRMDTCVCMAESLRLFTWNYYNIVNQLYSNRGFPSGSDGKESACNVGSSPGEGDGYPLQYSCLENPWTEEPGRGYSPWYCEKSGTTEQLTHYTPIQNKKLKQENSQQSEWGCRHLLQFPFQWCSSA